MYFHRLGKYFSEFPTGGIPFNRAQLGAVGRQMPIAYGIIIVNVLMLAMTHFARVPLLLGVVVPIILVIAAIVRMIGFLRLDVTCLTDDEVRQKLRSILSLSGILGAAFVAWALLLFPYGDAYMQGQVAFFSGVTVVSISACLVPVKAAANGLLVSVIVPYAVFLLFSGNFVMAAIAINMILVGGAMMFIVWRAHEDFRNLISHQNLLEGKQEETQQLSDSNLKLAHLDSLTQIPNRRSFFRSLEDLLEAGKHGNLAVGVVDLDGFKPINDVYGHGVGDQLLIEVGERLSRALGLENIARLGGDEFAFFVHNYPHVDDLTTIGQRICEAMLVPFQLPGTTARMSTSVGIAPFLGAGTATELYERADYALYHAKSKAVGDVVVFDTSHLNQIQKMSAIELQLREASLEDELSLAFQFVVDADTGRAVGVESLARWNSPSLGVIPPDTFIRCAERAGLISDLTTILFSKTLATVANWPDDIFVSFNLSSRDLASPECILKIISAVKSSNFPANRLMFEITESAVMNDYQRSIESLNLLKALGAKIALDDFGTGFSSLSQVRNLPLDRIKIDRSFVVDVETSEASRAVVQTVFDLSRNLGLDCIVEGVENDSQLRILSEMGCRYVQGYLFNRPMDSVAAEQYLAAERDGLRASRVQHSNI